MTKATETMLDSLHSVLAALETAHVHVTHCYGCSDISHMTPDEQRAECIALVTAKIEAAEAA